MKGETQAASISSVSMGIFEAERARFIDSVQKITFKCLDLDKPYKTTDGFLILTQDI